jgi:hypothetical protein
MIQGYKFQLFLDSKTSWACLVLTANFSTTKYKNNKKALKFWSEHMIWTILCALNQPSIKHILSSINA